MKIVRGAPLIRRYFNDDQASLIDKLLAKARNYHPGLYQDMFDEDFSRIFRSESKQKKNLFNVICNNKELTQKLFYSLRNMYGARTLDEILLALVEQIAKSLITHGDAYYFLHDNPDQKRFQIAPFSPDGVFRFFTVYFQFTPKRCERKDGNDYIELPRELRFLDQAKLIHFTRPSSIKRMLSKQNRTLAAIDKYKLSVTEIFPQATHEAPNPQRHFDFNLWSDTQEQALHQATRETGWSGRRNDALKCSDFFICHRAIRFRRNQLILRDSILSQLGKNFSRISRQYDAEYELTITPTQTLPQVAQLDRLNARLSREEISFSEVLDFCNNR